MADLLDHVPVIDLLALAWLLLGVLAGLLRGVSRTFAALLWVLLSLWLGTTLAPVLLSWLNNTEGTDGPDAHLLAYGSLVALALGVPAVGRLIGGRGGLPKRPVDDGRDKALGVVAGLLAAVLTLAVALPFVGRIETLARGYPRARSARLGADVTALLPWLYPPPLRALLASQREPRSGGEGPRAEPVGG